KRKKRGGKRKRREERERKVYWKEAAEGDKRQEYLLVDLNGRDYPENHTHDFNLIFNGFLNIIL
ncbi:hypothetical protein GSQ43_04590, partial [Clostridioides difficile]|uniref:hypothetical protein n=1 Tax=Clostridioides difficile TaxID=1496 RepID=UPI00142F9265